MGYVAIMSVLCVIKQKELDDLRVEVMYNERELAIERERLSTVMSAIEELQAYTIPAKGE